jgi:hypothetical protein
VTTAINAITGVKALAAHEAAPPHDLVLHERDVRGGTPEARASDTRWPAQADLQARVVVLPSASRYYGRPDVVTVPKRGAAQGGSMGEPRVWRTPLLVLGLMTGGASVPLLYSCRKTAGKPFLRPQVPPAPAAPILKLDPEAKWPQ